MRLCAHVMCAVAAVAAGCGAANYHKSDSKAGTVAMRSTGSVLRGAMDASRAEPSGTLGLADVIEAVTAANPTLRAADHALAAAGARIVQAGLRPNPELEVEVEGFGGSGEASGFGAAESALRYTQEIELGGKRFRRTDLAEQGKTVASLERAERRLEELASATAVFYEVLAVQEHLAIALESSSLAAETVKTVKERVKSGKVSPIELLRAEAEFAAESVSVQQARHRLKATRQALAATWGGRRDNFDRVEGVLAVAEDAVDLEDLRRRIPSSPFVQRTAADAMRAEAVLALERANARGNISVGGGLQHFEETGDTAFTISVGIPLSVSNRNQGSIAEAEQGILSSAERYRAALSEAYARLAEAHSGLEAAAAQARTLAEAVIPRSSEAYEAAKSAYELGKFGYLEVIDAQRSLIRAKSLMVEAQGSYHKARASIESLIGPIAEGGVGASEAHEKGRSE